MESGFRRIFKKKVVFSKKNDDYSRPRSPTHAMLGAKELCRRDGSNLTTLDDQFDHDQSAVGTLNGIFHWNIKIELIFFEHPTKILLADNRDGITAETTKKFTVFDPKLTRVFSDC